MRKVTVTSAFNRTVDLTNQALKRSNGQDRDRD